MNGLAEFFHCAGPVLMGRLTTLLKTAWRTETISEDWRNSLLVVLYKGKGPKNDCSNYRGISLLSVVGKILSNIIFKRINLHIADNVLPKSQCGFRNGRGTVDMIFTIRQLQEKSQKQCRDLFHLFIDLTKAFDTVNREALVDSWKVRLSREVDFYLKTFPPRHENYTEYRGQTCRTFHCRKRCQAGRYTSSNTICALFFYGFSISFQGQ